MSSRTPKHFSTRPVGWRARACVAAGLAVAVITAPLIGCTSTTGSTTSATTSTTSSTTSSDTSVSQATSDSGDAVSLLDTSSVYSDRDLDASYDESSATTITLSDSGSSASGSGVTIDGSTITITEEGTYVITGSLSDGQIVVAAADDAKVQIVLAGASITSSDSAAIYVSTADKVFLTLADGTENSLSTTGEFVSTNDDNIDGTVFSKSDLTINGDGTLNVTSASGHGIVCKDELVIVGGTINVDAAGHAIQGKDSVAIGGGTLNLTAGTDGIHCANDEDTSLGYIYVSDGTINVTAASDGFDAGLFLEVDGGTINVSATDDGLHAEYGLVINGGTIDVTQSNEALEGSYVTITGGTIDATASDDGVNASGDPDTTTSSSSGGMGAAMEYDSTAKLTISGGTLTLDASGDGLDSNGDIEISGGTTVVSGPTNSGNGSIDYGGSATISGGTLIAAGSSGMFETVTSTGEQGVISISASGNAGDTIEVLDSDGNVIASATVAKQYECITLSSPDIVSGGTYTIRYGSEETTVTLDGTSYSDVSGTMGGQSQGMGAQGQGTGSAPTGMGGRGSSTMGSTSSTTSTGTTNQSA
ncbi:MAG: carbohydrate-binding domain-containing protein [Tractidigestivibacter sp.]|jgi:hypothetical protein|uniref:carbohydrate-binding domain-containing protein n=1 Tax=Tractidigestivibacter sp. TaxID=2847320 RepID=UPI003D8EE696